MLETGGTWLEVHGAAFQINDDLFAFGDASYSFGVGGTDHDAFSAQIGLS